MRVRCPHCRSPLNVVDAITPQDEASCPSCGSRFPLNDVTVSYKETVTDRIGHFDLLEKVGSGQFGSVWRARDTKLNRIVALKIPRAEELDAQQKSMFLREARAAATLDHPQIVHVYEAGEDRDSLYIASQFIDGVTLRERLKTGRYAPRTAAGFVATVCDAVDHAHEAGIIHRDLKPSNILVDAAGQPHVSDFGLAKQENAEVTLTVSGQILGTPAYMSPEQARGDSQHSDRRSDVYSLGVILYEMLTGQRPFDGSSTVLLHQIQSQDPRSPRALNQLIPRDLETICLKALAKSPERRFATAKDMAEDLQRFCRGEPILARRAGSLERTWRNIRRNPVMAVALLIAFLSSAIALATNLSRPEPAGLPIPTGAEVIIVKPLEIRLETDPPGAHVVFYPLHKYTGEPLFEKAVQAKGVSPVSLSLLPDDYLVVAVMDDGRFHEVYRYVPQTVSDIPKVLLPHRSWVNDQGVAVLPSINIPAQEVTDGMALFEGRETFEVGVPNSASIPLHRRKVAPFYLDPHEVTFEEFRAKNSARYPDASMTRNDNPSGDFPVNGLFYDEAIRHAERMGKRLVTEWEFEFAGTMGGTQRFPWGNEPLSVDLWTPRRAGEPAEDRTPTNPPVFGLLSNLPEFVDSRLAPYPSDTVPIDLMKADPPASAIALRGGTINPALRDEVLREGVRARFGEARMIVSQAIGFRCARSVKPRWTAEPMAANPPKN